MYNSFKKSEIQKLDLDKECFYALFILGRKQKRSVSIESCVGTEENNLPWYVRNNAKGILEMVKLHQQLKVNDSVDPKNLKGDQIKER